jgi:hypothetical protein
MAVLLDGTSRRVLMLTKMIRTALPLLLLMSLVVPISQARQQIKHITSVDVVFYGAGNVIEDVLVNVRASFFKKPENYVLILTLQELHQSNEVIDHGRQDIPFTGLTVLAEDGGDGRTVVEVLWNSGIQVASGSLIIACATVIKKANKGDQIVSDETCRNLHPIF